MPTSCFFRTSTALSSDVSVRPVSSPCQTEGEVVAIAQAGTGVFWLELALPLLPMSPMAGQFAMVGFKDTQDPLLNRPLSIASFEARPTGCRVGFLVAIRGKGTKRLAEAGQGHKLRVIIPMGQSFLRYLGPGQRRVIAVAGGVGVAPMVLLGRQIKEVSPEADFLLVYGARTKAELAKRHLGLADGLYVATEDGSEGFKGRVTELFEAERTLLLEAGGSAKVFACGPLPMLYALNKLAERHRFDLVVSFEGPMGCGMGLCLGCVVENWEGMYVKLCQKGPVMDAKDVDWERLTRSDELRGVGYDFKPA